MTMTENNYTPGPWIREGRFIYALGEMGEGFNRDGSPLLTNRFSTHVNSYGNEDEADANARLIAAAPEMYEALRALLEYFEVTIDEHPPEAIRPVAILRNALAKADGM